MRTDFTFNDRQKQIFGGCMLGDGGLIWRGENCYFHNADIHEEYLIWLQKQLGVDDISSVKPVYDSYGYAYHNMLRTRIIPSIQEEYKKWYPYTKKGTHQNRNYKIAPKDIELTPTKVLFWYIGDCTYRKDNNAIIFTNTFNSDDAGMHINKLKVLLNINMGIAMHKHHTNDDGSMQYRIYLNSYVANKFFDLVDSLGFDIPDCYKYKFGV